MAIRFRTAPRWAKRGHGQLSSVISGLDITRIVGDRRPTKAPGGRVEEPMSSPVVTVQPDMPLREVAALLVGRSSRPSPPVRGGEIVGVVSEADIVAKEQASQSTVSRNGRLARRQRCAANDRLLSATTAGEAVSSPAITIVGVAPCIGSSSLRDEHGGYRS